jgi:outer membrane protein assembly factor BamB
MRRIASVLLLCTVLTSHAAAQSVVSIVDPSPTVDGWFGWGLAPFGDDLVVVGLQAIHVVDPATGAVLRTIPHPEAASGRLFSSAVAINGPQILVGSPDFSGAPIGTAYLFDGTTGALLNSFPDPTPFVGVLYGSTVAFLGSNVVVGKPYTTIGGAVYRFDAATGALLQTFEPPLPEAYDAFGASIAAFGDDVLIGAPGEGAPGESSGKVYLMDGADGTVLRTFEGTSGATDASFGSFVGVKGGLAVMTEPGVFSIQGRVHVFDVASGALTLTLLDPGPPEFYGEFGLRGGSPVAWMGDDVLVGSGFSPDVEAYLFDGTTGALEHSFGNVVMNLSTSVTTVAGNAVVGTPLAGFGAPGAGGVHVFCGGIAGCGPCETCGPAGTCVAGPNPTCLPPIRAGSASLTIGDSTMAAADRLVWKGGFAGAFFPSAFFSGQFGDPTTVSDHTLCLYDASGGALVFRARAPAGGTCDTHPCWSTVRQGRGFRYRDPERTPDGVLTELVDGNQTAGKVRLTFKGKGEHLSDRPLGLPSLPLALPVRLQLEVANGLCWQADFSSAGQSISTATTFRGKSD